jgi:integrase
MSLTEFMIKALKASDTAKKVADEHGLYLFVTPSASKLWRMDYRYAGKRKTLSFGAWPKITLSTARGLRDKAKAALKDGLDPSNYQGSVHNSFEAVARDWIDAQHWVGGYHSRVMVRFEQDVFPVFGKIRIDHVEGKKVLEALRAVEDRGSLEIAKRLRQHISAVFRYAVASGIAERDPAADIKAAMKPSSRPKHRAMLPSKELADFMQSLETYDGEPSTAAALKLIVHTFVRTSELRFAKWDEIESDLWRIPADRMKMRREHLVPITDQVRAILDAQPRTSPYIVPGNNGKPMSQNTMIFAMYRLGYHSRATVHGFRSLASTTLNESGLWRSDAIERQLAHDDSSVRGVYNAAQYIDERRRMMEWWSNWISQQVPS